MGRMLRAQYVGRDRKPLYPLQGCPSLHTSTCSLTWQLSKPYTFGIFIEASSYRSDQSLPPFLALLPSQKNGLGVRGSEHWLEIPSFWSWHSLSDDQPSSKSPRRLTSLEQKTLLSPRKFEGFQEFNVRNPDQRPNTITKKCSWCSCHLGIYRGFSWVMPQTGTEIYRRKIHFLFINHNLTMSLLGAKHCDLSAHKEPSFR